MEHLRVLKNSLKHVHAFQIELEFGSVFKGENQRTRRKTSSSKGENQQEIQPKNSQDSSQDHIDGGRVPSPLPYPCSPHKEQTLTLL